MSNPKYYMPGLPHDYYDHDMMHLHQRGNVGPFADPDFTAREADDQLPLISTVGRGPRGKGVEVTDVVDEDGEFRFSLKEDVNDEVVMTSPNLAPAEITLEQVTPTTVEFTTTKDGIVKKVDTVTLPTIERAPAAWVINDPADWLNSGWPASGEAVTFYQFIVGADSDNHPEVGDILIIRKTLSDVAHTYIAVVIEGPAPNWVYMRKLFEM